MNNSLDNILRPKDFKDVIGQESVCELLSSAIKNKSLRHSIILFGPSGVGKTTLARIVANSITNQEDISERDSAVYGKVDDIRSLQSDFVHMPWKGDYKVFIFDEAHRISNLGFDCLLKSIEEPPSHVKFIFVTTNFQQIPATIRSRSLCLQLSYVEKPKVINYLSSIIEEKLDTKVNLSEKCLQEIAAAGRGSIRNTLVIFEAILLKIKEGETEEQALKSIGLIGSRLVTEFINKYINNNFGDLYKLSKEFCGQYTDLQLFVNEIQQASVDLRLTLAFPSLEKDVVSDVGDCLSNIHKVLASSKDVKTTKALINKRLDNLRKLSLDLERTNQFAQNKQALIFGFLIDLATNA